MCSDILSGCSLEQNVVDVWMLTVLLMFLLWLVHSEQCTPRIPLQHYILSSPPQTHHHRHLTTATPPQPRHHNHAKPQASSFPAFRSSFVFKTTTTKSSKSSCLDSRNTLSVHPLFIPPSSIFPPFIPPSFHLSPSFRLSFFIYIL